MGVEDNIDGCPERFLDDYNQFKKNMNVAKKSDRRFIDLLRNAVKGNNGRFWGPVLIHGNLRPLT